MFRFAVSVAYHVQKGHLSMNMVSFATYVQKGHWQQHINTACQVIAVHSNAKLISADGLGEVGGGWAVECH